MPLNARHEVMQLGVGIALSCAAAYILSCIPSAAHSAVDAATASSPPADPYQQTRLASAPPEIIGPSYDDDRSLSPSAQAIASYQWHVRLNAADHRLECSGTIWWKNPARQPADEIYVHLYLNAFKNSETLFLRSPFGAGRSGDKATQYGTIDVKKMVAPQMQGQDLWQFAEQHSPGDPDDQTDIRVPLPESVPAGGVLRLQVEFEAKLPQIVERTGFVDSYHFAGQWFPKLAKRERDGTWVHFPFHPQSEFYADFGDYRVTLDVPRDLVLGATGERTSLELSGDRKIATYEQDNVTDFAWVAWDGFETRQQKIAGVQVRLLYPHGFERAARTSLEALEGALPLFNRNYGRYPYKTLTVVHPPDNALNSGGMEYPTLITTGARWYSGLLGIRELEIVTVHELAHQWFYGLVATDEHTWPFLDEGLASYAEGRAMQALYGPGSAWSSPLGSLSLRSFVRALSAARGQDDIVGKPAREFKSFSSLGTLVYYRTATLLDTLAGVYGSSKLDQALGRYARFYRFRHPTPAHLVAALRESLGEGAAENFEKAIFERGFVDYAVRTMQSVPKTSASGIFEGPRGRHTVSDEAGVGSKVWMSRAVIARLGDLKFPVDIELRFEDGSRTRRRWNGEGTTHTVVHEGPSRMIGVLVDPDQLVTLDSNLLNNSLSEPVSSLVSSKELSLFVLHLGANLLGP